jgi:LysR family transcriptional regulator, cyn operon transcriptional activator
VLQRSVLYLKAVADHGSFTRGAAAVHVSQPALSRQIQELEQRMGVLLLDRSGRSIRATDVGKIYLHHVQRALDELGAGERAIRDVQDLSSGELRLGFAPSFALYLLGPLVCRYRALYPGVTLTVTEMAQEVMEQALSADALDVALGFGEAGTEDIEVTPLHTERMSLLVAEDHPAARGSGEMDAADLSAVPLVLLGPTFATRAVVDRYLHKNGLRPQVAIEANSIAAILDIVRLAGLGTILPEAAVREQPGLRAVQLRPEVEARRAAVLWRRDGYHSAAARAFTAAAAAYTSMLPRSTD